MAFSLPDEMPVSAERKDHESVTGVPENTGQLRGKSVFVDRADPARVHLERRLGEALYRPRLPDRGRSLRYDLSLPASACLEDDLLRLDRIRMRGGMIHGA